MIVIDFNVLYSISYLGKYKNQIQQKFQLLPFLSLFPPLFLTLRFSLTEGFFLVSNKIVVNGGKGDPDIRGMRIRTKKGKKKLSSLSARYYY